MNQVRWPKGIRAVIAGDIEEFILDYPCHSPQEQPLVFHEGDAGRGYGPGAGGRQP